MTLTLIRWRPCGRTRIQIRLKNRWHFGKNARAVKFRCAGNLCGFLKKNMPLYGEEALLCRLPFGMPKNDLCQNSKLSYSFKPLSCGPMQRIALYCCKANVSLEQRPPEIRSFCDVKRFSRACAHKWKGMLLKAGNDLEKFQFLITP